MGRLDGRVAFITGGEGSVGMATARAFVAEGARVCLAGIHEERLEAGGQELGAEELAAAVVFLAGDESSFITGSTLVVDGGMSV